MPTGLASTVRRPAPCMLGQPSPSPRRMIPNTARGGIWLVAPGRCGMVRPCAHPAPRGRPSGGCPRGPAPPCSTASATSPRGRRASTSRLRPSGRARQSVRRTSSGIGVQKGGTSWWYELIADHPGVTARRDHPQGAALPVPLRHRALRSGRGARATTAGSHGRPGTITGEWTPDYLAYPWVADPAGPGRPRGPSCWSSCVIRWSASAPASSFRLSQGRRPTRRRWPTPSARASTPGTSAGTSGTSPADQMLVLQYEQCIARPGRPAGRHLPVPRARRPRTRPDLPGTRSTSRATSGPSIPRPAGAWPRLYADDLDELFALVPHLDRSLWPSDRRGRRAPEPWPPDPRPDPAWRRPAVAGGAVGDGLATAPVAGPPLAAPSSSGPTSATGSVASRPGEDGFDLPPPTRPRARRPARPTTWGWGRPASGAGWWHRLVTRPPRGVWPDPTCRRPGTSCPTSPPAPFDARTSVRRYHGWFPRRSGDGGRRVDPDLRLLPWVAPLLASAAPDGPGPASWCGIRWSGCGWPWPTEPSAGRPRPVRPSPRPSTAASRRPARAGCSRHFRTPTGAGPPVRAVPRGPRRPAGRHLPVPRSRRRLPPPGGADPAPGRPARPSTRLDPDTRDRLVALYAADVAELASLAPGLDLGLWPDVRRP